MDLRSLISTDIGPFHILLGVLVYLYAVYVHEHGISHPSGAREEHTSIEVSRNQRRIVCCYHSYSNKAESFKTLVLVIPEFPHWSGHDTHGRNIHRMKHNKAVTNLLTSLLTSVPRVDREQFISLEDSFAILC